MASRLLNPTLLHSRAPLIAAGLGVSVLVPQVLGLRRRHPLLLDSGPSLVSPSDWSISQYQRDAQVPVVRKNGGINARAVRQFSVGSISGLLCGLAVSQFSKSLAFLLGLLIVGVQTLERYGVHIVPYKRLQGYVKNVDLRSAVLDNVAFKVSFGTLFALSAFAEI